VVPTSLGDRLITHPAERSFILAVHTTYRADLRELNELNFARFDAKVEQRLAESDARSERRLTEIRAEIREFKADLN
jgi:hypothetical protein